MATRTPVGHHRGHGNEERSPSCDCLGSVFHGKVAEEIRLMDVGHEFRSRGAEAWVLPVFHPNCSVVKVVRVDQTSPIRPARRYVPFLPVDIFSKESSVVPCIHQPPANCVVGLFQKVGIGRLVSVVHVARVVRVAPEEQ